MIKLEDVSFSYATAKEKSLKNINIEISKGECILLTGESGCGKTTITRLLNGIIPNYYEGKLQGEVLINGNNIKTMELYQMAAIVGSVFQNPKSQFFNSDVKSELAFICENMGMHPKDIEERMRKAIKEFSIEKYIENSVVQLSGGEKQRIACAAVSTPNPIIYVLDEPSSNLDRQGIILLRDSIQKLKNQGFTIVIAEHRLHYLREIADRVIIMDEGEITSTFLAKDFFLLSKEKIEKYGLRSTSFKDIGHKSINKTNFLKNELVFENFIYAHKGQQECLKIDELKIPQNSITAVIGNNGAGKSTFSKCLCGIYKNSGTLTINDEKQKYKKRLSSCYMVMQDVNHQLFTESVIEEVLLSMDQENNERAKEVLEQLDLLPFIERHPVSLSGGQKQRTAIATAIVSERQVIVFDEPTSGLDFRHMKEVAKELKKLSDKGKTILLVTHDLELIFSCCNFIVEIERGIVNSAYPLYGNTRKLIDYFEIGGNAVEEKKVPVPPKKTFYLRG
ncbi:MAG: ABC transporter ATP-binding protein [Clostridiaceae bacterium]|nr:ABC transporter ATP-binding protein [Clostridiaceae bacterium]